MVDVICKDDQILQNPVSCGQSLHFYHRVVEPSSQVAFFRFPFQSQAAPNSSPSFTILHYPSPSFTFQEQKVQLNAVIYNSSILTCSWSRALALLWKLQGQRLAGLADSVTLNAAVEACGKAMQWQQAVQVLWDAMAWSLGASDLTYCLTIAACQTATTWQLAFGLLSDMVLWQFFLCLQSSKLENIC